MIGALRLFNVKAERLRGSRFVKSLLRRGYGAKVVFRRSGTITCKWHGPDSDSIHAAVLTLRFFIQDNESCSLHNLATIYLDVRIPPDIRTKFQDVRRSLNAHLDDPKHAQIDLSGEKLTLRRILKANLYGDLSHANQEEAVLFEKLSDVGLIWSIAHPQFVDCLVMLTKAVFMVEALNKQVLQGTHLERPLDAT